MSTNTDVVVSGDNSGEESRNRLAVQGVPTDGDYAVMSYSDLQQMEVLRTAGLTLFNKDELLGVPHIITRVTYWTPMEDQLGMVSCECTIADEPTLQRAVSRGWIPNVTELSALRLEPNERGVYNDGGTGVRRQVTMILQGMGLIDVGDPTNPNPDRFDRPWPVWDEFAQYRYQSKDALRVPSFDRYTDKTGTERPFLLGVTRGLSVSEYENTYTKEGRTFYLR